MASKVNVTTDVELTSSDCSGFEAVKASDHARLKKKKEKQSENDDNDENIFEDSLLKIVPLPLCLTYLGTTYLKKCSKRLGRDHCILGQTFDKLSPHF